MWEEPIWRMHGEDGYSWQQISRMRGKEFSLSVVALVDSGREGRVVWIASSAGAETEHALRGRWSWMIWGCSGVDRDVFGEYALYADYTMAGSSRRKYTR